VVSCTSFSTIGEKRTWRTAETNLYPAWFLFPARTADRIYFVGYGPSDYNESVSIDAALESALYSRAILMECRISVRIAHIHEGQAKGVIKEIDERPRTLILDDSEKEKLEVLDSFVANNSMYALFTERATIDNPNVDDATIDVTTAPVPEWTTEIPEEKGFIYAIGSAGADYREYRSWVEAEKDARAQLALSIETSLKHLFKQYVGTLDWISTLETDLVLHNIEIAGRWKNAETNSYHVCIRLPVDENSNYLCEKLNGWMESIPETHSLQEDELKEKIQNIEDLSGSD
jgi:hypothetical protein